MITEPINPDQVIVLADGEAFPVLCLEGLLYQLRRHGRVELQMAGAPLVRGHVPSACELAIAVLKFAGATVSVTASQLDEMNRNVHENLV